MCWFCGLPLPGPKKPFRADLCPECGKDLRACKNCKFYSLGSHWDCSETVQDQVVDKERGNFCEWFSYNPVLLKDHPGAKDPTKTSKAQKAFDSLFGD